jgi:hypothetical protein
MELRRLQQRLQRGSALSRWGLPIGNNFGGFDSRNGQHPTVGREQKTDHLIGQRATAPSNERPMLLGSCVVTTAGLPATLGVPNKPVLPTATTWFDEHAPVSLRRQTGQSLGSVENPLEFRSLPLYVC